MAQFAVNRYEVMQYAKPLIEDLANAIDKRSLFVSEEHGLGVYVNRVIGERAVDAGSGIGTRWLANTITSLKPILSRLPETQVEEILDQRGLAAVTPNTLTEPEELSIDLERVSASGVAFKFEDIIEGLIAVAAPVIGLDDDVLGSIGFSGPSHRMKGEWFREAVAD